MRRLLATCAILTFTVLGAPEAWAQSDPWHVGNSTPGALEGGFQQQNGVLNFLVLGSPRNCNDGTVPFTCDNPAHIWFYDQTCSRVNDISQPLKANQVAFISLGGVTNVTQGNFLVATAATAAPGQPILNQPDPAGPFGSPDPPGTGAPIIGGLFVVDVVRGIGRVEPLARLEYNYAWMRYSSAAALLLALADDRAVVTEDLLLRCPTGVALINPAVDNKVHGTAGTLGGDMLELAHQGNDQAPIGDAYLAAPTVTADHNTMWDRATTTNNNGLFATGISAAIYDTNGALQQVATTTCQCFTSVPLSTVSSFAAGNQTYWEIISQDGTANFNGGKKGIFTGGVNMQVKAAGLNLNFFTPLFMAERFDSTGP